MHARQLTKRNATAVALTTVVLLSAFCVWPALTFAASTPGVRLSVQPTFADGYYGWHTGVTTVTLMQERPGRVLYQWDHVEGPWAEYEGRLLVPEGKHVLFARVFDDEGPGPLVTAEVKVDFEAPARRIDEGAVRSASGMSLAGDGVAVTVEVLPWAGTKVQRLGGADRYETSAMISAANWDSADTVIIATGRNFADALSASGLSGCYDAPVLLTQPYGLSTAVVAEITRLGPSRAFVVGGTAAVEERVAQRLRDMGIEVKRLGGADRYETAALIAYEVMSFGQYDGRVYVARGDGFADALALGPLAFASRAPLLLVRPYELPNATRAVLRDGSFHLGVIAGGEGAIQASVETDIDAIVLDVIRLAGDVRYDTAGAVASWAVNTGLLEYVYVGVATGLNYADALCGGVAAGHNGGVILLTLPDNLPDPSYSRMETNIGDTRDIQLYGGAGAVFDVVFDEIHLLAR